MDKPPPTIGSAKVLAYAAVDESIEWAGEGRIFVGDPLKPLGRVPKLAICKFPNKSEYDLFYCDDEWGVLACLPNSSLGDAKNRAEEDYRGISTKWRAFVHEDEAAIDRQCMEPCCEGCGRSWIELYELGFEVLMREVEGQPYCMDCKTREIS